MNDSVPRLLVVNPNTNGATTTMMVDAARRVAAELGQGAVVVGATAASGPAMIVDPAALAAAAAPTVAAGCAGVAEHLPDAVVVGAFGDPGAVELRAALRIPVIGIGEAAIREAAGRGTPFAIVTSTPLLHDQLRELVVSHCPGGDFVGLFFSEGDPVELARDPDRNVEALGAAIDDAVAAGAQSVVIGGGPLTSAARQLAARSDVAVIEPVSCAVGRAFAALRCTHHPIDTRRQSVRNRCDI